MEINDKEIVRAWDQRVGEWSAHITTRDIKALHQFYENACKGIDFSGKHIVDYGAGGGLFYDWLFKNYNPLFYVGIDIADRQINILKDKIIKDKRTNTKIIKIAPSIIPDLNPGNSVDILVILEVVHHIPNQKYYEYLFSRINTAKIPIIIMTHKYADTTVYRAEPYKTTHDIALSCHTNYTEILKYLTEYRLSDTFENDNKYLRFELKSQKQRKNKRGIKIEKAISE